MINYACNKIVPESELSRIELLKSYSKYDEAEYKVNIKYYLGDKKKIKSIVERFKLDELFGEKQDFELAQSIFDFVCNNFKHNGGSGMPTNRDVKSIIKFCDNHEGKINCRGLAMLTAGLMRCYGIKATHITCMPYEEPFSDCHVVVECYVEKLHKWIMMDPTYHLLLYNKEGDIINLSELRNILINNEELTNNEGANYYSNPFDLNDYREYMVKNTFRFQRGEKAYYGCEDNHWLNRSIMLIPTKYLEVSNKYSREQKGSFITNDKIFWAY